MPLLVYLSPAAASPPAAVAAIVAAEGSGGRPGAAGAMALASGWKIRLADAPSGAQADSRSDAEANDLLNEPPPAPGTEPRVTDDPTGVVARCDKFQQGLEAHGLRMVRKVVSRNAQYGVVWRADMATPGNPDASSRLICWRIPGRDDVTFLDRPLQMFNPADSIPPLGP